MLFLAGVHSTGLLTAPGQQSSRLWSGQTPQTCFGNGWVVSGGEAYWPAFSHLLSHAWPAQPISVLFSPVLAAVCCRRSGNEELWAQPALEMPKRRDILAIVLIVLPWTLLVTVWHQSTIAPLLATHKGEPHPGWPGLW